MLSNQSQESKFIVFSDSLSALQAMEKLKTNHPLLIQIQDTLHKIEVDQKEVVFMWVPGHVGIGEMRLLIELLDKLLTRNQQMTSCPFQIENT